jgi:myo-inositol 2-dehydrogenase / D-chiro-inositol 1-dehydrogenase
VSDPVRIALVGAGRMGRVHLAAINASDQISLAGIVEPADGVRANLESEHVPLFASPRELIAAGTAEGVLIAAPSPVHASLVSQFAAAGIPVLCEKPIGVSPEEAARARDAALQADVVLQVGYWRRFVPQLRELRARIEAGELGEIFQLSCMQWDQEPPSASFRADSGGIAIDMGVHEIDQIHWLLGERIEWVAAVAAGRLPPEAVSAADPDAAVVLATLSGLAVATISLGRRFPYADSCWLELWGTRGYERVPFMWDADVWSDGSDEVFVGAMRAQVEAFARAVRGGPCEGADGDDAVAALTVAAQVAESLAGRAARAPGAAG